MNYRLTIKPQHLRINAWQDHVAVIFLPLGLEAVHTGERSQFKNRQMALDKLTTLVTAQFFKGQYREFDRDRYLRNLTQLIAPGMTAQQALRQAHWTRISTSGFTGKGQDIYAMDPDPVNVGPINVTFDKPPKPVHVQMIGRAFRASPPSAYPLALEWAVDLWVRHKVPCLMENEDGQWRAIPQVAFREV